MHCIYKDNLVPYPMPGTTLPVRGGISGQLDLRYTSTPSLGVEVYRAEAWISNPDSGVADLIGYLGVVCGDQKYSNRIRVLSLRSINILFFCPVPLVIESKPLRNSPNPGVEPYR